MTTPAKNGAPVSAPFPSGSTSYSMAMTVGSGSSRCLVVDVMYYLATAGDTVSVTWNGVSMTSQGRRDYNANGRNFIERFYLMNPAATTADVVVSVSAHSFQGAVGAQLWNDVDSIGNFTSAFGSGSPASLNVSGTAGNTIIDGLYYFAGTTATTSQTAGYMQPNTGGDERLYTASATAAGATTAMSYTLATATVWVMIGSELVGVSGDTTAPVLSSPTGTSTGTSTATVGATTDEGNGTLYAVVTTSATQPSVAQIKAGQNHLGAAATWGGNQAISSTGAKTFSVTGLTTGTTYYAHFVHTDAATNNSAVSSTSGFVPGYVLSVTPVTLTPSPQSVSLILVGELNYTLVINAPATVTPSTQVVALSLATPVSNLVVTPVTSNIVFSVVMPITRVLCSPLTQSVALNATGQPNTYVLTVTPVSPTITPQDVALNPSYALSGSGTSYRQRRRVSYATRYFSRG